MSTARDRILEMLSAGTITARDAEELLRALGGRKTPFSDWLFHPMTKLETSQALALAAATALLQLLVSSLLQIRFDGALDLHQAGETVPWSTALLDLALGWPVTALILFAVARPIAGQGRLVDFFSAVGVARLPNVAGGVLLWVSREFLFGPPPVPLSVGSIALSLSVLLLGVWFAALLVSGLRAAAGLRGGKLALASIVGLVAAEALTKMALVLF